jgi:DNA-directed RNA polymerase specialized sigma24 family protein
VSRLSPLEYETARQYAIHGNRKEVAAAMGCSVVAVHGRVQRIRATTEAVTMIEWFMDVGWLRVPEEKP